MHEHVERPYSVPPPGATPRPPALGSGPRPAPAAPSRAAQAVHHLGWIPRRIVIRLVVALVAAGVVGLWPDGAPSDREQVESTVHRFLEAHAAADAGAACAALSGAERRDASASRRGSACGAGTRVPAAERAEARRLRDGGLRVSFVASGAAAVAVTADGSPVTLLREDGAWKIDALAVERAMFVEGCSATSGGRAKPCGCLFDQLRARGMRSTAAFQRLGARVASGVLPASMRESATACAGAV